MIKANPSCLRSVLKTAFFEALKIFRSGVLRELKKLLLLFFLINCHFCLGISQIPQEDQRILEAFLKQILHRDGLIFVAQGSKPMGTVEYATLPIPGEESERNKVIREGWKTWCHYRHLFSSKNLLLRSIGNEESDFTITLLLVHRRLFKETLHAYQKFFKIDPEETMVELETSKIPLFSILHKNHFLTGILYGYGINNSLLFQKRCQKMILSSTSTNLFGKNLNEGGMLKALIARNHLFVGTKKRNVLHLNKSRRPYEEFCEKCKRITKDTQIKRNQIGTIEETEILENSQGDFAFGLPIFAVDPNIPETEELRKKYARAREEILLESEGKTLLEFFLQKL